MNSANRLRPPSLLALLVLFSAAASAPRPASAQLARADTAAVLLAAARDFDDRGEGDIAAALYRHVADRFPGTDAAAFALGRLQGVTARRSQAGGEVELKVWSALYGIWQGIAVPIAADAESAEAFGMGLLLGGPLGFLAGREMARSRPRSLGQARAITWGGTWGAIQGWGWAKALDLGKVGRDYANLGYDVESEDVEATEAVFASMIAGGAAGIAGGLVWARREITPGTATSAMLGSLWGMWFGFSTAFLADVEGDGLIAASMLAGNAGLVAGALAGSRLPLSRGRARIISVGGVVGAFGGLGLTLIGQPDDEKAAMSLILASSVAGLAVASAATGGDRDGPNERGDAAGASPLPAPGALLSWSDGDWAFSTPLPSPVLESPRRGADGHGLVWKFPLVKLRF
ncbi:MAG: hypothetical protein OXU64_10060 [Gemmatimonadota bacterium]|nr:hypothetical protein [Gemmatimonadota bacterium]